MQESGARGSGVLRPARFCQRFDCLIPGANCGNGVRNVGMRSFTDASFSNGLCDFAWYEKATDEISSELSLIHI